MLEHFRNQSHVEHFRYYCTIVPKNKKKNRLHIHRTLVSDVDKLDNFEFIRYTEGDVIPVFKIKD